MSVARVVYSIVLMLVRGVLTLWCRLRVVGRHHVPAWGPALLAVNHVSFLDAPAVATAAWRRVRFVAKAELFRIPGFGPLITVLGSFPVHRGRMDRRVFRTIEALLARGEVVLIFPEGRRSPTGRLLALEAGVAFLARRTGAPIVPVALIGTNRALPADSWWPRPARVEVRFGPPLRVTRGTASREVVDALTARLTDALCALLPPEMQPVSQPDRTPARVA